MEEFTGSCGLPLVGASAALALATVARGHGWLPQPKAGEPRWRWRRVSVGELPNQIAPDSTFPVGCPLPQKSQPWKGFAGTGSLSRWGNGNCS